MAPHSSTLAWETSWTEEPGGYIPQDHEKGQTQHSNQKAMTTTILNSTAAAATAKSLQSCLTL